MLVSALIRSGRPRELWNLVLEGKIELVISQELLAEFDDVMSRPEFRKYVSRSALNRFHKILLRNVRFTKIKSKVSIITEDEDDNAVLESGYSGRVEYLVTGDSHVAKLKYFRGIKIVSINEMLEIAKEDSPR